MRLHELLHEYKLDTMISSQYGSEITLYTNPSYREFQKMIEHNDFRGITSSDNFIVWDAMDGIHEEVEQEFGDFGPVNYYFSKTPNTNNEWQGDMIQHNELYWSAYKYADNTHITDLNLLHPMVKRSLGVK